jgi:probable H4MPT-linked C1 transfer pathway protein
MERMADIVGWDIGGVNTKAVCLPDGQQGKMRSASSLFEIWRAGDKLPGVLRHVYDSLKVGKPDAMAVTMTAELADVFESKRQGVLFVLKTLRRTFPDIPIFLLSLDRKFETLEAAIQHPSSFAAANWLASALFFAGQAPDCLLVDVGSTTTDIIPIRGGDVATPSRTDVERLMAGELVYSGILRTNPNTVVDRVPVSGTYCPLAAEAFAQMADVYLLLGLLDPDDYTVDPADGGPKTVTGARRRLARLVCADAESMSPEEIHQLANYLHEKQLQQVVEAVCQVRSRQAGVSLRLVAAGCGRFLAVEAGRRLGLTPACLDIPPEALEVLPCLAVAALLEEHLAGDLP